MNLKTLSIGTAGLVAAGLMALPVAATASGSSDDLKRNEDTPDVVLLEDDDEDDETDTGDGDGAGDQSRTRTGDRSGRDESRDKPRKDWTKDGAGDRRVDLSRNQTNDRTRHDTRG